MVSVVTTGCKINLFLHIGQKKENGYHELETFFIPLQVPSDTLTIQKKEILSATGSHNNPLLTVCCDTDGIDVSNNTLTNAFLLYTQKRPLPFQFTIQLTKGVPHGAGLGGGSANAAGLLLYLQGLKAKSTTAPLSKQQLSAIATKVGADVPFFLVNKPAFAYGKGEILTTCPMPYKGKTLLLVCPSISVSTAWAYRALDTYRKKNTFFRTKLLTKKHHHANSAFADCVHHTNDFEDVVFAALPELAEIKSILLKTRAEKALLSGTGSSIFGIFSSKEDAKKASQKIQYRVYMQTLS